MNEQITSLTIASTCSVGLSAAIFGEIDGQSAAEAIPIKQKLNKKAFKILSINFMKAIVLYLRKKLLK